MFEFSRSKKGQKSEPKVNLVSVLESKCCKIRKINPNGFFVHFEKSRLKKVKSGEIFKKSREK